MPENPEIQKDQTDGGEIRASTDYAVLYEQARKMEERASWNLGASKAYSVLLGAYELVVACVSCLEAELAEARKKIERQRIELASANDRNRRGNEFARRKAEERAERAEAELRELEKVVQACIPWVGSSGRGVAQEALARACKVVNWDPFDWTAYPDVLRSRLAVSSASEAETYPDHFEGNIGANIAGGRVSASEPCGFVMDACMCDQPKGHAGLHSCAHRPSGLSASGEAE